ncbi:MAG: response regulator [Myxococcales bacterium]|nr:response regulator [Myxococcales bacterium]MCB9702121.1 response regulator [Myxococcales bacterium]
MRPRVLIIDDNHELADNLAELLGDEGYEITIAESGERALAAAREQGIDTVLADLRMPGVKGVALAQSLTQLAPGANFLVMTAYASDALLGEALAAGVQAILVKPLDLRALLRRLPRAPATVLLLEDDTTFAEVLTTTLEDRGYVVRLTKTTAEASAAVETSRPDAALFDIYLPDGNGAKLARSLCVGAPFPVLLMTGYDADGAAELVQSLPARASRFLTKPFPTRALLDALRSLVRPPPSPAGAMS